MVLSQFNCISFEIRKGGGVFASGPLETALVQQVVMAQWRLARLRGIETGLFELGLFDLQDANAFRGNTDTLAILSRYEARIERSFFRALHELQRVQAARQQPDPPPPAKTISAKQTQSDPEPAPNPMAPNDLPPAVGQALRPAIGILFDARRVNSLTGGSLEAEQALHYVSTD